jgi:hypothetical protein
VSGPVLNVKISDDSIDHLVENDEVIRSVVRINKVSDLQGVGSLLISSTVGTLTVPVRLSIAINN